MSFKNKRFAASHQKKACLLVLYNSGQNKNAFPIFFLMHYFIFLMHSSWLHHIQLNVSTYYIQTYKYMYINKQIGIHCTQRNDTMKTEKKNSTEGGGMPVMTHIIVINIPSVTENLVWGICIPNMNTVSPRVSKKLKHHIERLGERYGRTNRRNAGHLYGGVTKRTYHIYSEMSYLKLMSPMR